jgi:methionyl-tRNA synthetase
MLQQATPWVHVKDPTGDGAAEGLARLAFGWRLARFLAITSHPFLPFSADRLWAMLGQPGEVTEAAWEDAIDWTAPLTWSDISEPLFARLDLEEILAEEQALAGEDGENTPEDPGHGVKGSGKGQRKVEDKMEKAPEGTTYLDFETFMQVELKTGTITSVEDHPNADKLYVVHIDDGTDDGRIVCAGLKDYYTAEQMTGKHVVFVANLKPRKLRGVVSEGMICAADDGEGAVRLITVDGEIADGSQVR